MMLSPYSSLPWYESTSMGCVHVKYKALVNIQITLVPVNPNTYLILIFMSPNYVIWIAYTIVCASQTLSLGHILIGFM